MSENEFLNALREEMPEDFGRDLLDKLKAEDKVRPLPQNALWTVAVASIITVIVGAILLLSRQTSETPLNIAQNLWTQRETITPENISQLQPLLTLGYGYAHAIALSPDDSTLAVATSTGIYLHDAHDLNAAPRILGMPDNSEYSVYETPLKHMEYSDDGRLMLIMQYIEQIAVYQWDETNLVFSEIYRLARNNLHLQKLDISPDGDKLLIAGCSRENAFWSVNGQQLYCENAGAAQIRIFDMQNDVSLLQLDPVGTANALVALNSDWTEMLYHENMRIKWRDLNSNEERILGVVGYRSTQLFFLNESYTLAFSPDDQHFITLSANGENLNIFDLEGMLVRDDNRNALVRAEDYQGFLYESYVIGFNPVNQSVLVGWRLGLKIFEPSNTSDSRTISADINPTQILVSSDGERIYALGITGLIRVWDWESQDSIDSSLRYTTAPYAKLAISPDSSYVMGFSNYYVNGLSYVWDVSGTHPTSTTIGSEEEGYFGSASLVISPDGRYIAYYQNYAIWVYDQESREARQVTAVTDSRVPTPPQILGFRSDGTLLHLSTNGGMAEIRLLSPETIAGNEDAPYPLPALVLPQILVPAESYIYFSGNFSPNGDYLVLYICGRHLGHSGTCTEPSLKVFNTVTGEMIQELFVAAEERRYVNDIHFTSDSRWLGLGSCPRPDTEDLACEPARFDIWDTSEFETVGEPLAPLLSLDNLPFSGWSINLFEHVDEQLILGVARENRFDEQFQYIASITTEYFIIEPDGSLVSIAELETTGLILAPDRSYAVSSGRGQIQLWGIPSSLVSNQP